MNSLNGIAGKIDAANDWIGRTVAWLAVFMVLVQFSAVVLRYVFGIGSIWMQESVIYMHAFLFMVGAGYTLLQGGHVRVDIFYREAPPKRKALTDLIGVFVFLIPVCVTIWLFSWGYVVRSWEVLEGSKETSGIQGVFLLKSAILVFAALVTLQGISLAARSLLVLAGSKTLPPVKSTAI